MDQKAGYKKTKIGWIPKDWDTVKSSKVASIKGGNGFPQKYQGEQNGEVPFIKVSDMNTLGNEKFITVSNNYVSKELAEKLKLTLFNKDSIVFAKVGAALLLNRRRILAQPTVIDNNMMGMTPTHYIDNEFLYQYYIGIDFGKFVQEGALPSVNQKMVGDIPVPFPPLPEQKKIASILTTVDDKISSIENQIQQTEQLKKGLMEKLLTEGIGHTEFKDTKIGRMPKGWALRKIGEIGFFKNGINKGKEDFGKGIPFVNLMDIFGSSSIGNKNFGLVDATKEEQRKYNLRKGDVLFVRSSVKPSGVGLTALVEIDLPDTVYSGFLIRFRENKMCLIDEYKKYCFYDRQFRNRLFAKSSVSANTNINQVSLSSLLISIPTPEEQKQIASILSTVDSKIEVLFNKKHQYQTLKKGLSQQLLTGQMRVKV